jgi:regulation of enolase protein 1 (concanavalin A-like superfamily)
MALQRPHGFFLSRACVWPRLWAESCFFQKCNEDSRFAAGIEVVDGTPFVSCVTTNVYSDWSTQKWNSYQLHMRVHKLGESAVVEVENEKGMRS